MKKIFIPIMIITFIIAFYNENTENPNLLITIIAVVVLMFGMMKLSSKIPSKNKEEDGTEN